ncbi:nickel insertion protein [Bacillus pinisoli]|uniref:nickel insertion protein n=1 Tax=Bacillus pinisoli TaxID=2901866 RepID=UPI001FF595A4|nr:nickel insertion protein [Bacillus pinisoli]
MKLLIEKIEVLTLSQLFEGLCTISPFDKSISIYEEHPMILEYVSNLKSETVTVDPEEVLNGIACLKWILKHKIDYVLVFPHVLSERTLFSNVNLTGLTVKYDKHVNNEFSPSMACILRVLNTHQLLQYQVEESTLTFQIKSKVTIPTDLVDCHVYILKIEDVQQHHSHLYEHVDTDMLLLQANIDDMNPEILPYVMEQLLNAGANDVFAQPIMMKKGRHAFMLNILCQNRMLKKMESIIFTETTTIGVRKMRVDVHRLGRFNEVVETAWGEIKIKIAKYEGQTVQVSPEYEDCKRLALKNAVPLKLIYQEAVYHIQKLYGRHVVSNKERRVKEWM